MYLLFWTVLSFQSPFTTNVEVHNHIQQKLTNAHKTTPVGIHHISHLPANEDFQSTIIARNDDNETLSATMIFYGPEGQLVNVMLERDNGEVDTTSIWIFELAPSASIKAKVISIQGGARSCSMTGAVLTGSSLSDDINWEVTYTRFVDGVPMAIVGVPVEKATAGVRINFDRTGDQIRGMAIHNTLDLEIGCVAVLFDTAGALDSTTEFRIPGNAKWLGLQTDLFPSLADFSTTGNLFIICDDNVSVLGLVFEGALFGSIPVARFTQ